MCSWWSEIDTTLFLSLNGDLGGFADTLLLFASGKLSWLPLYALLYYLVYRKYGLKKSLVMLAVCVAAVGLSDLTASFFKTHLPKLRPSRNPALEGLVHTVGGYRGGLYGTVSAHAATCTAIAVYMSLLIRRRWVNVALAVWVALVCYSRIYLGVHYPADILFGIATGTLFGLLCYFPTQKYLIKDETLGT